MCVSHFVVHCGRWKVVQFQAAYSQLNGMEWNGKEMRAMHMKWYALLLQYCYSVWIFVCTATVAAAAIVAGAGCCCYWSVVTYMAKYRKISNKYVCNKSRSTTSTLLFLSNELQKALVSKNRKHIQYIINVSIVYAGRNSQVRQKNLVSIFTRANVCKSWVAKEKK